MLYDSKRVVTARALTFCELYRVDYNDLVPILSVNSAMCALANAMQAYPDVGLVIRAVAIRRMRRWKISVDAKRESP